MIRELTNMELDAVCGARKRRHDDDDGGTSVRDSFNRNHVVANNNKVFNGGEINILSPHIES